MKSIISYEKVEYETIWMNRQNAEKLYKVLKQLEKTVPSECAFEYKVVSDMLKFIEYRLIKCSKTVMIGIKISEANLLNKIWRYF